MRLRQRAEVGEAGTVVHLLLRLEADPKPDEQRSPVNLALVIDRSSSMRGPRIAQALRAASLVVDRLGDRDRLTIVTFDAAARAVFGPDAITETTRPAAHGALAEISTGVGTNLAAGFRKGADALRSGFVRGALSRLVLLTDGQPSIGVTDPERLCALVAQEVDAGVTTTAMGIGETFEEELLAEMARRGCGGFHYLAQPADVPAAFGRELDGVFAIAATSVTIKVVPHADVIRVDLAHRLPSRPLEDGLLVEIGEVAAGAPRSVLLRLSRDPEATSQHLATLTLTYRNADGGPAEAHIVGVDMPEYEPEQAREVILERVGLEVATAVDTAWARRASGDSMHALAALAGVRRRLEEERDRGSLDDGDIAGFVEELGGAEAAVVKSAAERERLRRGMKERSQLTLLGRSTVRRLPPEED